MEMTPDLFEIDAGFLSWLPDETFFSVVSRIHQLWGHPLASRTCLILFGRRRGGIQHDLPSCLDEFVARTRSCYGTADEISVGHTLLRYYRIFMEAAQETAIIATLRGPNVSGLKFRMGLLTSRFRANHPLKACLRCMQEDRESYGWAYWHIQHQYPGVWTCEKHGQALFESDLKSTGVERFHWHLPDEAHLRPTNLQDSDDSVSAIFSRLTNLTTRLVDRPIAIRIDPTRLHQLYRVELERRNLLTSEGSLRLSEIANEFLNHVTNLRKLTCFSALPATIEEARQQLTRLLRSPRTGTHPLRHMILIEWLFGNDSVFFEQYSHYLNTHENSMRPQATALVVTSTRASAIDDRRLTLKKLLEEEGKSMRAAAAVIGVDTTSAMVWAAQMGISASRRPKKLKPERRKTIIAELMQGKDKAEVAKAFDISIVTVTHVLRTEVGLHAQWTSARELKALAARRETWFALVSEYGKLGVKFIRNMNPSCYTWLYRNDRAWLTEHTPKRDFPSPVKNTSALWDKRDLELSSIVERSALKLNARLDGQKLKLWQLYQEVPELKAKLDVLDRLPLTMRAIEVALKCGLFKKSFQGKMFE